MVLYIYLIALLFIALILHTTIHESGHLVFGLISGYKFSSFRIMSFVWVRINGKIRFKRYKIAGTGGQCLMIPPEINDGDFPVMLYNYGGVIFNLVFSAAAFVIDYCIDGQATLFGIIFVAYGVFIALANGIPITTNLVSNDGSNALKLSKSRHARKSLWFDLMINAKQVEGMRLKDMPAEWFYMPSDEELKNGMIASRGVAYCSLLVDLHRFEEAEVEITRLLALDSGIAGIHKKLLICDLIYLRLILDMRFEMISELFTKDQERFMNSMKRSISILRVRYTYALLGERNSENGEKYKKQFEKIAKIYPFAGDLECERELMSIADEKST